MNRLARVAFRSTARLATARFAAPVASPFVQHVRNFSASPSSDALAACLKEEIQYENENAEVQEEYVEAKNNILKLFKLTDNLGESSISLTRNYNDETIIVNIDCQDVTEVEPSYDEEEQDDQNSEELPSTGHNFEVIIKKKDSKLVCGLTAVTDGSILVNSVTYVDNGDLEPNDAESKGYFGPSFQDLDEKVQNVFLDYLAERNIDSDLAIFVLLGSFNKEQSEYVNFLKNVVNFLK